MAPKKEPLPDPRSFNEIRDGFWKLKYPNDPTWVYKDWAIEKPTKKKND